MAQEVVCFRGADIAPHFAGVWGDHPWPRIELVSQAWVGSLGAPTAVQVEKYQQPQGEAGVMNSLRAVAKMATEGMIDSRVRSWAISRLKRGGNPQTSEGRGRVLLGAVREEKIWVPDPTDTELIQAAHLTLGDGENAPYFDGGDCDDLATAMLGAYLSVCATVDAKAAVVGHSYRPDKQLEHVLGAVLGDDGRWYYVEPSSQVIPFGSAKKPTREVVILVPSQKTVCDANECFINGKVNERMFNSGTQFVALRHGGSALDALSGAPDPRKADRAKLDRLQAWYEGGSDSDRGMAPEYFANRRRVLAQLQAAGRLGGQVGRGRAGGASPAARQQLEQLGAPRTRDRPPAPRRPSFTRMQKLGADAVPPVAAATSDGWNTYLTASADTLEVLQERYHALYDGVLNAAVALGLPKFDDQFDEKAEQELINLDAMIAFMIKCLRDGASGVRRLVLDGNAWGIEGLLGDLWRLLTVQEEDGTQSVVMVKVKPPETAQRRINASLGYGPVAIAGLVAAGLAAMGIHFLMLKTLAQTADSALQAVLQYRLQSKYIDCINEGKCTPEQVVALQKAFADAGVAMTNARTAQIKAENKPLEDAVSAGKLLLGLATLVIGVIVGYEFKDTIKGALSGGGKSSGRSSNPSGARTQRNPAGSRTAGGTMISRY